MSRCSENAEKTCKSYPNCDGCNAYGNKMMTDAEIMKALECCLNDSCYTSECFFFKETKDGEHCQTVAIKYALDLINRQKAEIERRKKQFVLQSGN